jgi:GT2 family glycosyltransferase
MTPPRLSICVAVHRVHGEPNLASVAASLPAALAGLGGELVVALNGISAEAAAVPPGAVVTDLGTNLGVSSGWNAAAEASTGEILVFANDDVTLGPGSLLALANALEHLPEAGVVGPRRARWDIPGAPELSDPAPPHPEAQPAGPVEIAAVEGFLFALRRSTFDAVGGFDVAYDPCLFEEIDFCTAVRQRLGLRVWAVPDVDHHHRNGISARRGWPWTGVTHGGRRETLRSIRRRNRRHYREKWST